MVERLEFEVLVVGAGPAGLAAAAAAAERCRSVGIVDENPAPGGQIWRAECGETHPAGWPYFEALRRKGVNHLPRTAVIDALGGDALIAERDGHPVQLRYDRLVIATGARERFLPFPGWTLPNVMGVGGLQAMVKAGLDVRDRRVVVAGSGPLLLAVAASLVGHGARVEVVAEQAPLRRLAGFGLALLLHPDKVRQGLAYRRQIKAPYQTGTWVTRAFGNGKVESVTLSNGRSLPCDLLACAYGLVPNVELPTLLGCRLRDGYVEVDALGRTSVPGVSCAGEPTLVGGVDLALIEGRIAGLAAAGQTPKAEGLVPERERQAAFARALEKAFALREELRDLAEPPTLVCRCEDVRRAQLQGAGSWREAKLQTRCGMGPCQGRVCGAAASFLFGWDVETARTPIFPTSLGSLAEGYSATSPPETQEHSNAWNGAESSQQSPPSSTTTSRSTTPSSPATPSGSSITDAGESSP